MAMHHGHAGCQLNKFTADPDAPKSHMANFRKRRQECNHCGFVWTSREEKETDVNIAVHLINDAHRDRFDRAILITADSDLKPAIATIRAEIPVKRIFAVAPPGRFSRARDLKPWFEIKKGKVARHLLPARIIDDTGNIVAVRPSHYEPPVV